MGRSNFPHHTVQHNKAAWKGGGGVNCVVSTKFFLAIDDGGGGEGVGGA